MMKVSHAIAIEVWMNNERQLSSMPYFWPDTVESFVNKVIEEVKERLLKEGITNPKLTVKGVCVKRVGSRWYWPPYTGLKEYLEDCRDCGI